MPGAFKLDHLQPIKPLLFPNFCIFSTFILGGQFLLPQRTNIGKREKGVNPYQPESVSKWIAARAEEVVQRAACRGLRGGDGRAGAGRRSEKGRVLSRDSRFKFSAAADCLKSEICNRIPTYWKSKQQHNEIVYKTVRRSRITD